MAEQQQESVGAIDAIAAGIAGTKAIASKVSDAITRDGALAAFVRQGADEMAAALKAFPESISVDEPGTILNPTQGEIAAARRSPSLPSPSDIARDKQPYRPEPGHEQDHGRGMGRG